MTVHDVPKLAGKMYTGLKRYCSRLMRAGTDAVRPSWARRAGGLPQPAAVIRIASSIEGVAHDGRNASSSAMNFISCCKGE